LIVAAFFNANQLKPTTFASELNWGVVGGRCNGRKESGKSRRREEERRRERGGKQRMGGRERRKMRVWKRAER
jgi:hypothetical protein